MNESKGISIAENEFIDWIDFDTNSVNLKNIDGNKIIGAYV